MKIISHRGNINGPDKELENNPLHIKSLINSKFEVEVDVWLVDDILMLGHDLPQYVVTQEFLNLNGLWCHAKNLNALKYMLDFNIKNCFWHQNDNYTLTSSGYIWTYPNNLVNSKSIIVDLDSNWKDKNYKCWAVCVDFM